MTQYSLSLSYKASTFTISAIATVVAEALHHIYWIEKKRAQSVITLKCTELDAIFRGTLPGVQHSSALGTEHAVSGYIRMGGPACTFATIVTILNGENVEIRIF